MGTQPLQGRSQDLLVRQHDWLELPAVGVLVERLHQSQNLLGLGRAGAEMHRNHAAAALHHQPRCHRRVDAAGEQAHHPALAAQGKPAGSRDPLAKDQGPRWVDLDAHRHLGGLGQIRLGAGGLGDSRAHVSLDLGRDQGEGLVGPPHPHLEGTVLV